MLVCTKKNVWQKLFSLPPAGLQALFCKAFLPEVFICEQKTMCKAIWLHLFPSIGTWVNELGVSVWRMTKQWLQWMRSVSAVNAERSQKHRVKWHKGKSYRGLAIKWWHSYEFSQTYEAILHVVPDTCRKNMSTRPRRSRPFRVVAGSLAQQSGGERGIQRRSQLHL